MRDYIGATRAVWRCWQDRTLLEFESEHYTLNLMVPVFGPGPIAHSRHPDSCRRHRSEHDGDDGGVC